MAITTGWRRLRGALDSALPDRQGIRPMKKAGRAQSLNLSWDEIGFLCEGVSLASRPMGLAVKAITVAGGAPTTGQTHRAHGLRPPHEAKAVRHIGTAGRRPSDIQQRHPG
jgi:hypothetical protein